MYIKDKQSLDICQQIYSNRNKNSIRLLNILTWYALRNALVYIKQSTLAAQLGLSRQQTNTLLKQLEDSKLITTQYRGVKRTKLYFVNPILFSMALVLGHALSSLTSTSIYFLDSLYPPKKSLFFSAKKPILDNDLTQEENKGVINDQESDWQSSTLVTLPQSTPLNLFNKSEWPETNGGLQEYVTVMHNGQIVDGWSSALDGHQLSDGHQPYFLQNRLKEEELEKIFGGQQLIDGQQVIYDHQKIEEIEVNSAIKINSENVMQVADLVKKEIIKQTSNRYSLTAHGNAKLYIVTEEILQEAKSYWDLPYKKFIDKCIELAAQKGINPDWGMYRMIMSRYQIPQSMPEINENRESIKKATTETAESKKSGRLPVYVPPVIELDYDKECEHFYQAVLDGKVFKGYELTYPPFMEWLGKRRKDNPAMITKLEGYLGYKIKFDDEILSDDEMIKELTNLKETLQSIKDDRNKVKPITQVLQQVVHSMQQPITMTKQDYIKNIDTFDDGSLIFIDDNFIEDSVFEEVYD